MSELWQRFLGIWDGLSVRERSIVSAAAGLFALTVLYLGLVSPVLSSIERARARAEQEGHNLELVRQWRRQLEEVNSRLASVERRIASGPRENLRTTLDRLRTQAGISKFESIDEKASKPSEEYRETQMEVVLKSITLAQLVKYLHEIESTPQLLSVKRLRIARRTDDPELLDVRFVVSSFESV